LDEFGFRKLEAYATEGGMPNQPNDRYRRHRERMGEVAVRPLF
jgi:hypothetical protein